MQACGPVDCGPLSAVATATTLSSFDAPSGLEATAISPHRIDLAWVGHSGGEAHFGGDTELCKDFLAVMRDGAPSRTPLSAGITSALTCLMARESSETGTFREVKLAD